MLFRLIKFLAQFVVVLSVVVLAVGAVAFLFYRAMPEYAGVAHLPGLSGEVRVYRDPHGVPHIFAPSMNDAARALGYIHASERLYQMEIQRRAGPGPARRDRRGRSRRRRQVHPHFGLLSAGDQQFRRDEPRSAGPLSGLCRWRERLSDHHKGRLAAEFLILGDDPEPWRPADLLVWGKLMSLQLSHNYAIEDERAQLAQKMPPDMARLLFPSAPAGSPITTLPVSNPTHSEIPSARNSSAR